MKVILVGDSCSGKTSVLRMLEERGFPVVFEEGWQLIPKDAERDKLKSNLWFTKYFFERERPFYGKNVILENCLHFQYPFTHAQHQAGKIILEQRDKALLLLDTLVTAIPLEPESMVIHLTCSSEQVCRRLETRGRLQEAGQVRYREILRDLTERYFQPRCRYHKIDTTSRGPDEVFSIVMEILSQEYVS